MTLGRVWRGEVAGLLRVQPTRPESLSRQAPSPQRGLQGPVVETWVFSEVAGVPFTFSSDRKSVS